jgi:deoxycytidine triphosphate deaminase
MQHAVGLAWGEKFVLHPNEVVLAATLEYIVLPGDLSAQVITRSSFGRLGLLSATAVQIHPHFHGCLTLELVNLGVVPVELTPGERVAQLVVTRTALSDVDDHKKYRCPTGPEFSRVRDDGESAILRQLSLST